MFLDQYARPASAATATTSWSQTTSASIGHYVPQRHIPVIKGDVNFVNNNSNVTETNEEEAVPSAYIQEVLDRLRRTAMNTIDHEDALEFLYDLFYMHPLYNQDDTRIARLFIDHDYVAIVHHCLAEYMKEGIFSNTSIRRSTQFILYTLWNFTGVSIEFRLHLANKKSFVQFLLDEFFPYIIEMKTEGTPMMIIDNLKQAVISIIHNLTLNVNHLPVDSTYARFEAVLMEETPSKNNERFRITLLLCLIHLNPKQVNQHLRSPNENFYQSTMKVLFRFLKKIVQQEILMISTGLSAWVIVNALNKLPAEIILQDDQRFYSLMVLFKRGMREEKLQSSLAINRCLNQSNHAREILEKDTNCWNLFQQFQVFIETDQNNA